MRDPDPEHCEDKGSSWASAGLQLSLSWPGGSPPLPGVWFAEIRLEEARLEAFKAKFICKEIRLKMENA